MKGCDCPEGTCAGLVECCCVCVCERDGAAARGTTIAYAPSLFGAIALNEVCPYEWEYVAVARSLYRVTKHVLRLVLIELAVLRCSPIHPVALLPEEGPGQARFNVASFHGRKYHTIVDRWKVVWVTPCCCVVDGCAVLVGHDVHLIKVDLRNICIGANVDVFGRDKSDSGGRLLGALRGSDDGGDVAEDLDWCVVDGDDDAVA